MTGCLVSDDSDDVHSLTVREAFLTVYSVVVSVVHCGILFLWYLYSIDCVIVITLFYIVTLIVFIEVSYSLCSEICWWLCVSYTFSSDDDKPTTCNLFLLNAIMTFILESKYDHSNDVSMTVG